MKKIQQKGNNIVMGDVRLGFVHLSEPDEMSKKYTITAMIPKENKEFIAGINAAYKAAYNDGLERLWSNKKPADCFDCRGDGDNQTSENEVESFRGHYTLNAKTSRKVKVLDKNKMPVADDDIYSGMWAIVSLSFFPYVSGKNKGVSVALNAVVKTKDDDRLGGGGLAVTDDFFDEDEDDGFGDI